MVKGKPDSKGGKSATGAATGKAAAKPVRPESAPVKPAKGKSATPKPAPAVPAKKSAAPVARHARPATLAKAPMTAKPAKAAAKPPAKVAAKAAAKPPAKTPVKTAVKTPAKAPGGHAPARPVAAKAAKSVPAAAHPPAARSKKPAVDVADRLASAQRERAEFQDMIRQLRADFDSARAEAERLRERVRELESEPSRTEERSQQPLGPGEFDPTVDLDDDIPSLAEDEMEGAAGFFDRMDDIRARRNELDRERNDRELEQSDQAFWMICPKCGDLMEEQESENIKLERCENCGGLYLDRGEVDLLISVCTGPDGQRRLHNTLKF